MKQTIDRRAVLDCIGFDLEGRGELAVRFQLASFSDEGKWMDDGSRPSIPSPSYPQGKKHRLVLMPGDDIDAAMAAIGAHLETMGYSGPSESDIARLKGIAAVVWTPEATATHIAAWDQWERDNSAHCLSHSVAALTLTDARMIDFAERVAAPFAADRAHTIHN